MKITPPPLAKVCRFGVDNSDETEYQARCYIFFAFAYIMQSKFKGSWYPKDNKSGESVKRVLEILLVPPARSSDAICHLRKR